MTPDSPPLSYTIRSAAAATGISRAVLYKLVADGELLAARFGRRVIIPRRELERLLEEHIDNGDGKPGAA